MDRLQELNKIGQSAWLDYLRRDLITSGKLKKLIDMGVRGMTTNPSIFEKAIGTCEEYDETIKKLVKGGLADPTRIFETLAIEDIKVVADAFMPIYDKSSGTDGMVSLEVSPFLAADTQGSIEEGRRLWKLVNRPNAMIKIPATPEGIPAFQALISEGINVNVTLMFSMKHYESVAQAYIKGLAQCADPRRVTSVASVFVSRVDSVIDKKLDRIDTPESLGLRGKVAVANCKLIYKRYGEIFTGPEFLVQRTRGARMQRVLWGSTSTKNPAYADTLYVDELVGPASVNTIPMETLEAFLDHGKPVQTVIEWVDAAKNVVDSLAPLGIDLDAVNEELQRDGVKAFADSFTKLLKTVSEKSKALSR